MGGKRSRPAPEFMRLAEKALKRVEQGSRSATGHARRTKLEDAGDGRFVVSSVVCGDGSVGKSGMKLEKGKFYGSGATKGGYESFHEIDIRTLALRTRGSRSGGLWNFYEVNKSVNIDSTHGPRKVNIPANKRGNYTWIRRKQLEVATEWMLRYPGVAIAAEEGLGSLTLPLGSKMT